MTKRRVVAGAAGLVVCVLWAVAAWLLWRTRVPGALNPPHPREGDFFTQHELRRAARFNRFEELDWVLSQLALVGTLAVFARKGAASHASRQRAASEPACCSDARIRARLGGAAAVRARGALVGAPFGNSAHQSYPSWVIEGWCGLAGTFLFLCFALLVVMGLARPLPRSWPIAGVPVFVGLVLLLGFVQPYLLPSSHRLYRGPILATVRELATKEHVKVPPVEVQDVHGQTSAPNAEALGLGASRRVVVWSTLLDGRFSQREVRFVLAHELGHLARNHLWKGIAWYVALG